MIGGFVGGTVKKVQRGFDIAVVRAPLLFFPTLCCFLRTLSLFLSLSREKDGPLIGSHARVIEMGRQ